MNRRQFVSAALTLPLTLPLCVTLGGCTTEAPYRGPTVIGEWIDAKPLQPEETIVFNFLPNGEAETTEGAPWAIEHWSISIKHTITLSGTYLKNGVRVPYKTTYNIRELTLNTMLLEQDGNSCVLFVRNQVTQSHSRQRGLSAHLPDRDAFWRASRPCRAT